MDTLLILSGILIGIVIALILNHTVQKGSFLHDSKIAHTLISQAKLRADLQVQKAQSEVSAKKALLESRALSDTTELEEQSKRLAAHEQQIISLASHIQDLSEIVSGQKSILHDKENLYKDLKGTQIAALEKAAKTTESLAWEKHLDQYCKEEKLAQEHRLEKISENVHDQVEQKAKSIMNVINQRYIGESTRDPTLIEIKFTPKEFERIVGDEQLTKIIHLQNSLGSELKLEYSADNNVRVYGYDLWRRYIVKGALERLKKSPKMTLDLAVQETQKFTEDRMLRIGKNACDYLGIKDFPTELVKLVGRLDYRTSFGQNIYRHSIEVALLGKMIAEEIGCDPYICIVGGLLHDIGKGVDADVSGGHDAIGRDIAIDYHLHPDIVHSIFAHHELEPYRSVEARVVQLADAISAARPGARHHEPLEEYIARMKALEEAAISQSGVEKAFVMQAGREIRAFVDAHKTNDVQAEKIAKQIVDAVQASNAARSGEVKIQVIRELDVYAHAGKRKAQTYRAKR